MSQQEKITRLLASIGSTRLVELEDGSIVDRSGGTVSWRNNSPGNLKFEFAGSADPKVRAHRTRSQALQFAQARYDGIVALDQWGNAVFETSQAGRAAQIKHLRSGYASQTIERMVEGYSRPDYSGPTHHSAQVHSIYRTADAEGFDLRGKCIGAMTPAELNALADGVAHFEGFVAGRVTTVRQAVVLANGPATLEPSVRDIENAQANDLHLGDHGPAVSALQAQLNRLGYTDALGRALSEDGRFGRRTRDALAAFQQASGLVASGHADARVQASLRVEDAKLPTSPAHPDHAEFGQVLRQLRSARAAQGMPPGGEDLRIAAALLVQMRRDGLQRADRVELSGDGARARVVQVNVLRDEPALNRTSTALDVTVAMQQPLHNSSAQLAALASATPSLLPPAPRLGHAQSMHPH